MSEAAKNMVIQTAAPQAAASAMPAQEPLQDGYLEALQYLPVQRSLTVGAADDPLEEEADRMADTVMRMPEQALVQRKCAACEEEEVQRKTLPAFIQRSCAACQEEEVQRKPLAAAITPFIQAKGSGGGMAGNAVSQQIQNTRGGGSSMDRPTQSFMESRFGADFSNVKIHTGDYAVQLSRELNAQAFTVGSDIYFNEGKYNPGAASGRHLLAHELTHTVQQGAAGVAVQRTVSPDIERIRGHLSYGIFDWAITNGDVQEVLNYLRQISSDDDLRDTVVAMGSEMVNRLVENLAESDLRNEDWVGQLMGRVHRFANTGTDVGNLRGHLSYGIFDWEITDTDVSAVLLHLRYLTDEQLQLAVSELENGGYIDRLYENLQESADSSIGWVEALMIRIHRMRTQHRDDGTTYTGSCNAARTTLMELKRGMAIEWAETMAEALLRFIVLGGAEERVAMLLDRYFFHQAQTGALSNNQQLEYAETIRERVEIMKNGAGATVLQCASPFDSTCSGGVPGYVQHNSRVLRVCNQYFRRVGTSQTEIMFHELMHFHNRQVSDTGYTSERIFAYLPPDRSLNNADSYSDFAAELVLGADASGLRTNRDTMEGCTPAQEAALHRDIAFAVRMIQNANNDAEHLSFNVQNAQNAATANFKVSAHDAMNRYAVRIRGMHIPGTIHFRCAAEGTGTARLPYVAGDLLALTPGYFSIAADNERVLLLIAILFSRYASGMGDALLPNQPGYAAQTADAAYNNPGAYAGYARDISFAPDGSDRDEWNFADAGIRYGEQLQREVSAAQDEINDRFGFNPVFEQQVLRYIVMSLEEDTTAVPIASLAALEARRTAFRRKADLLRSYAERIHRDYERLYTDSLVQLLLLLSPQVLHDSNLGELIDTRYREALISLRDSLRPVLGRIRRGEILRIEDWGDYPVLFSMYQGVAANLLTLIRSYQPYLQQLGAITLQYRDSSTGLTDALFADAGMSFDDQVNIANSIMSVNRAFNNHTRVLYGFIRNRIQQGIAFNAPGAPRLPALDRILRRFRQDLNAASRQPLGSGH